MNKSVENILGFEYDWLARDADDHVGLFSTAGGGYAPDEFLSATEAHAAAIDAVLDALGALQYRHLRFATSAILSTESLRRLSAP